MEKENHKYGTVTVGTGTNAPQELEIVNFVQSKYKDNRLVSISELEDNTFILAVENPESSGRAPQSVMRLSKESFMALISGTFLYWAAKGEDMSVMMKDAADNQLIDYSYSNNLSPITPKDNA